MGTARNRVGKVAVTRPLVAAACACVLLTTAACTGSADPEPEPTTQPSPTVTEPPVAPTALTFGVWGPPAEIEAYQRVVDAYNLEHENVEVELAVWADEAAATESVREGEVPDVFLLARRNLPAMRQADLNQPVSGLLDERAIEFGDGYQRAGLRAFSGESVLQCMPHGTTPMVIFYNTGLVDFERMRLRGLTPPEPGGRWSFRQFSEAADFATRPRRNTRGVYIEPTLRGLAPFIRAGGGRVFDDDLSPTSLALSDEDGRAGLETTLQLLRNPLLTPTPQQLERRGVVELFATGRLAMIAGFRDLVPELREVEGLDFDVMPMPSIDSRSTVGDLTGMCLARDTENTGAAADFLAHLVSADAVSEVARAGYLVPANLEVAESEAFLQPDQHPANAGVFNLSVRDIVLPPLIETWDELNAVVTPLLHRMLNDPLLEDLDALTQQIDEASRAVLAPEEEEPDPDLEGETTGAPSED